jgi:hypothetical protein
MEQFASGKATRTRRNCYRYVTVERVKGSFFFPPLRLRENVRRRDYSLLAQEEWRWIDQPRLRMMMTWIVFLLHPSPSVAISQQDHTNICGSIPRFTTQGWLPVKISVRGK